MNPMQGVFRGFDIAAAGLHAEMQRAEIVAANISNMHVTRTEKGGPYTRKSVVFQEVLLEEQRRGGGMTHLPGGVKVASVYEDEVSPYLPRYDPGHPDADASGFVKTSNVDLMRELVDLSVIERSFQANLAAMNTYRGMVQTTIQHIGR